MLHIDCPWCEAPAVVEMTTAAAITVTCPSCSVSSELAPDPVAPIALAA